MLRNVSIIGAVLILIGQGILQLHLARSDSAITDESIHILAGYLYLTRQDFSYNPEHPPLVKELAALPLLFIQPHIPEEAYTSYTQKTSNPFFLGDTQQGELAHAFMFASGNNADKILFLARIPMIFLTLLLGAALYVIAVYLWGWLAGLIPLLIYALDPTIAAHGHLVTTDIGLSLFVLLATFLFWRFLEHPTWKYAFATGTAISLALAIKFSAIILLPICILLAIHHTFLHHAGIRQLGHHIGRLASATFVTTCVLLPLVYFGQSQILPAQTSISDAVVEANQWEYSSLSAYPWSTAAYNRLRFLMHPHDFWRGLYAFTTHASAGHSAFLLGESSETGWWYYFPVLLLTKTPLPTLTLILVATSLACMKKPRQPVLFFTAVAMLYLGFSTLSNVNIGVRHVMPVYILLLLTTGSLAAYGTKLRTATGITLILLGLQFFIAYPHYLSYFNFFAGGTAKGHYVAVDSNYDWGQDLKRIQEYFRNHPLDHPYIEYRWNSDVSLAYYGVESTSHPADPQTKTLVIGATALHSKAYAYLQDQTPIARITPSVFVFDLRNIPPSFRTPE